MTTKAYKIKGISSIRLFWQHRELFIWIAALVMLYTADLHSDFTLCIPSHLGIKNCPGCGIGHAITAALHGDFIASWHYHILGIPALGILLFHIAKLTKNFIINRKTNNYGQHIV